MLDRCHYDGTLRKEIVNELWVTAYSGARIYLTTRVYLEPRRNAPPRGQREKKSSLPEKFKPKPAWQGQK